ncbi:DUF5107 domain-containing protein [Pedobacter foliorum]|uniref:DUF5107 domain-containing protein n=1 Tax=Pedobacter foliorum TaxID=2739058 RepID=UPI0015674AF1|nr:DUF5107 domain-containing protein [Pedobacter foliorum]NRF37345.1 DUF5107 domain-containing protein [Pedobacter foliorum]
MKSMSVSVWEEKVTIPTYGTGKPNKNPMFFEKRIYQGSSGAVYPNPVVEKILDEKTDKEYVGLFLENDYIKMMILPELGGRIQMAYDKIKERHFIYYNQVIKPALVGLTGPWISGGIEFNWPQHHRPTTFNAIDYKIEENSDGSKTVWVNEVEQMFHTKGMAGFTLHPDKAYIEIKAKLLNRSALPQTFLWWANPAVKVNDYYQSVFPPDVNAVFDHGKRDVSTFPVARGTYYKVDYSPGTDISMYKNIPVPTSYMAINSDYDFVGGYEHDSKGGLLHVANHHVSPGKKQWTWGHSDFGVAWDRNLTDEDGPYIELMTGMFTDNQPDFTWLMPNEEKSFTQYFMPYRELGVIKNASKDILLSISKKDNIVELKIQVTSVQRDLAIKLSYGNKSFFEAVATITPLEVYIREIEVDNSFNENELLLIINNAKGHELLRYEPSKNKVNEIPEPAKPAMAPDEITSNEQLFLTGQHLEQYRHATYSPVPYYEKALEREPGDIRNNNALGLWYLRRGQFEKSEPYFRKAIETSIERNPNPYDCEAYYNLGLCLKFQDKLEEAYKVFYKSTWNKAYKDSAYFSVAQIDMIKENYELSLDHINQSIDNNANNSKAYVIKSAAHRKLNQADLSIRTTDLALEKDAFNLGALFEKVCVYRLLNDGQNEESYLKELLTLARANEQNFIEYSIDYAEAGLFKEAIDLLSYVIKGAETNPLVYYYLGYFNFRLAENEQAIHNFKTAAAADSYLCFPNRLQEIKVLRTAIDLNPEDSKAPYYLGNLFYDKRQYQEAIAYWEASVQLDGNFPTALRNLGIAYFNKQNNEEQALACFEKAFELDPQDDRLCMELHQLYKRLNKSPQERLSFLDKNKEVALQRDDVYLDLVSIYNFLGENEQALRLLMQHKFHPWEGGEGKASGQYVCSLIELAKEKIQQDSYKEAIVLLKEAQTYPHNLGEGKLYGAQENDIFYWLGCAYEGLNDQKNANDYFDKTTKGLDEPSAAMFYNDQQPDKIFYQGLAWKKIGNTAKAEKIFNKLIDYGSQHINDVIKIDYFAVSLPNLLIFEDDLDIRNKVHCYFLQGLGYLGLAKFENASDALLKALELDAEHLGAKLHLDMVKQHFNYTT